MKKVSFQTVGCRLNQYETEKMAANLCPYGFHRVNRGEPADLYIINTCTVTHRADSDCRYLIRRAARQNPVAKIVVAGCYVDNEPILVSELERVDVVIKNSEKDTLIKILSDKLPELFNGKPDKNCSTGIADFYEHNRAWIKVSDGCNQRCTYCILPKVRGPLTNRPALGVIDEINHLIEHGYEEVVLTGINLGYYHNRKSVPKVKNLAALCRMILSETDLKRLRLSSIEPQTVRDELLEVYASSSGRICRHWHIPMQSGSDRILKKMRRPYKADVYIKRITDAKKALPGTIIGADVIVGFPGETEEDFGQSRQLAMSGLIDYLHVFSYSDRPGTFAAEQMPEKIKPDVIRERNHILKRISDKLSLEANKRQIDETLEVISEHRKSTDGVLWAVSDNYIRSKMPDWYKSEKTIVKYKVHSADQEGVYGDIISDD